MDDTTTKIPAINASRILVVDDDSLSCRLLQQNLSHAGFEVRTVMDGEAALDLIRKTPPDLLVLDFEMPGLSGAEVCRKIRDDLESEIHELPIIMLTAHSSEADEILCWNAGANDFVSKPVSRSVLVAMINIQLKLSALSSELLRQNEELSRWREEREADLDAARHTQQVILPTESPKFRGWKVHSVYAPIIQVGGDIYGWRQGPDDSWMFWLADATGHGASAALFTTLAALLFSGSSANFDSPGAILEWVNERFYSVFAGHSIMSACCLIVHPDGRALFANAGHPPLLIKRANGAIEAVTERETVLGIHEQLKFTDACVTIAPGETALLFTDGLHSLLDHNGHRMEESAVRSAFANVQVSDQILDDLSNGIKAMSDGGPFLDDVAAISIQRCLL